MGLRRRRRIIEGQIFQKREYERTAPDIVEFVVHLGLGGPFNLIEIDRLATMLMRKIRYSSLPIEEVRDLIVNCDGMVSRFYRVEIIQDKFVRVK